MAGGMAGGMAVLNGCVEWLGEWLGGMAVWNGCVEWLGFSP